jgi:hypothetical protein
LQQFPPALFDDYIMGAFLLYAAWRTGRDARAGQRYLAAVCAFACGLGYFSFFSQLNSIRLHEVDPAPISSEWVAFIKGVAFGLAIVALVFSLRRLPASEDKARTRL